jgi:hypothetical protein
MMQGKNPEGKELRRLRSMEMCDQARPSRR